MEIAINCTACLERPAKFEINCFVVTLYKSPFAKHHKTVECYEGVAQSIDSFRTAYEFQDLNPDQLPLNEPTGEEKCNECSTETIHNELQWKVYQLSESTDKFTALVSSYSTKVCEVCKHNIFELLYILPKTSPKANTSSSSSSSSLSSSSSSFHTISVSSSLSDEEQKENKKRRKRPTTPPRLLDVGPVVMTISDSPPEMHINSGQVQEDEEMPLVENISDEEQMQSIDVIEIEEEQIQI